MRNLKIILLPLLLCLALPPSQSRAAGRLPYPPVPVVGYPGPGQRAGQAVPTWERGLVSAKDKVRRNIQIFCEFVLYFRNMTGGVLGLDLMAISMTLSRKDHKIRE